MPSAGVTIIGIFVLVVVYQSVVIAEGKELALIERKWFGKKRPQGKVVAMNNKAGVQVRTLGPGIHFLIPFNSQITVT